MLYVCTVDADGDHLAYVSRGRGPSIEGGRDPNGEISSVGMGGGGVEREKEMGKRFLVYHKEMMIIITGTKIPSISKCD